MRRKLSLALVLTLTASCLGMGTSAHTVQAASTTEITGATKEITFSSSAMEVAEDMKAGWNLGNGLDAYDSTGGNEYAWGNPTITQDLINTVKSAGFNTIRVDVTYMNHIGNAPNYTIDRTWLNRVQQVVDYVMNADMYAIIDIHADANHDYSNGAWLHVDDTNQDAIKVKYQKVWEQIVSRFKDYGVHLIFESMNEIMEQGNYNAPNNASTYENINAYNQIFVNTVRNTGSNNANRFLLMPGYNTNIEFTAGNYGFKLPEDSATDKQMVSVHFYDPHDFCLNEGNDAIYGWGQSAIDSGDGAVSWHNETSVLNSMSLLEQSFTSKGIPVIVGEFGAVDKSFTNAKNSEYRRYFYEFVSKAVSDSGGVPICWDNGWIGNYGLALFDRTNNTIVQPDLVNAIMRGTSGTNYTIQQPTF